MTHDEPIARNYAEALLALARKSNAVDEWGARIHALARAIESSVVLRRFLEAPQVGAAQKRDVLGRGLQGVGPPLFVRFVQKLVSNRRQMLIPGIAAAYSTLVDAAAGRVHARVTLARPLDPAGESALAAQLSRALKKEVVPHVTVNPNILGGVVVRIGDTVMDGSVRRRLGAVRTRMLGGG